MQKQLLDRGKGARSPQMGRGRRVRLSRGNRYLAGRKAAPEGLSIAQRKERFYFPRRRQLPFRAPLRSPGGPNSLADLYRSPRLPYLGGWLSPPCTRLADSWAGCKKFLIGGVAGAPGEKSSTSCAPDSGRRQGRTAKMVAPGYLGTH